MTGQSAELARIITRENSKQTYYTARLMVDRHLEFDCFRAYGYFRWVDDVVDIKCQTQEARLAFIHRQEILMDCFYQAEYPSDLTPEEEILADLIRNDNGESDRLRSYTHHFLKIIEFDAERKGRLISQQELDWYASTLGKAVTDGIQYFICNGYSYPESEKRYLAATGAHIAHMLRDMAEDIPEGYINIPREQIERQNMDLCQFDNDAMRSWVRERVQIARQYFTAGKQYLNELRVLRCKIVGHWYCARFEYLLNQIEADGFVLRSVYPKSNKWITWFRFARIAFVQTWQHTIFHLQNGSGLCGRSQNQNDPTLDAIPKFD